MFQCADYVCMKMNVTIFDCVITAVSLVVVQDVENYLNSIMEITACVINSDTDQPNPRAFANDLLNVTGTLVSTLVSTTYTYSNINFTVQNLGKKSGLLEHYSLFLFDLRTWQQLHYCIELILTTITASSLLSFQKLTLPWLDLISAPLMT